MQRSHDLVEQSRLILYFSEPSSTRMEWLIRSTMYINYSNNSYLYANIALPVLVPRSGLRLMGHPSRQPPIRLVICAS